MISYNFPHVDDVIRNGQDLVKSHDISSVDFQWK